jgi:hypothetical protein
MADVGSSIVKKAALLSLVMAYCAALVGCGAGSGEISAAQQQSKIDASKKVAKKLEGPNWVPRGQ